MKNNGMLLRSQTELCVCCVLMPDRWQERSKASTAEEKKIYDTKVYKAQVGMVEYMSQKLNALGVPFFGSDPKDDKVAGVKRLEMQRKMLEHLEAAYGPD
jgi:hypothetical protein